MQRGNSTEWGNEGEEGWGCCGRKNRELRQVVSTGGCVSGGVSGKPRWCMYEAMAHHRIGLGQGRQAGRQHIMKEEFARKQTLSF